ncbi:pyridoxal-phosphate dependent enzyme [Kitasatospora sp. NPDC058162]|uniref:pyridoxal-phosphate dependent enzyme n=1 Tax=Kitasatospora sp. NPDC058162 TaxID=3346362 RepID=UPI0036DC633E
MLFDSVHDAIGHTPVVRLRMETPPGVEVYAKLELQNLFGMKDRVARNIILEARRTGALTGGAPIVESSSGTMALGVALVGASLGHPVHIVTDPRIDSITLGKLQALGCQVHIVEAMSDQGWQGARLQRLEELMVNLPGAFWPQQYSNPDNPAAYRALASELLADVGHIDILVGSVGSGGSLCGSTRALRERLPHLFTVGVDCVGSALFAQPDEPRRLQSGLGNSLVPRNLDHGVIDEVHWLNDHEAFAATRALAAEQQIFGGNTSGSVYRVLTDLARRAEPGTRIVGLFPDRGDRYTDTVYSDEHWQEHSVRELPLATTPESVDYGTVVRTWSRAVNKSTTDVVPRMLFVESNTTGTGMIALQQAKDLGLSPVLLTSRPERYVGLAETGCEVVVCDTNDSDQLRTVMTERFRRDEIAAVTTTSDFYVPAVAELARLLDLPGNPVEAAAVCRHKAELRTRLAEADVPQPRFAVLHEPVTADQMADAVAAVGLPCVVKPVDDSGSNGVLLCHSAEQALEQAGRILGVRTNVRDMPTARSVLVEEYVQGPEYSVELFGGPGGTTCVGITQKTVTGTPYFVECAHLFPAPLSAEEARTVEDAARRAVAAAGMVSGATHTEVRLAGDRAAIMEINPRPAGGMIPELIRLATGVDLLEQQLRVAAGLPPNLAPERAGHAGIRFLLADREGALAGVDGTDEAAAVPGVERVTVTAAPGAPVRPPANAYHRLGHLIAYGGTPAEVEQSLAQAESLIRIRIEDPSDTDSTGVTAP